MKKNIPNIITAFRIAGTVGLLFLKPFTTEFFILYTLCGLSDVIDGTIARLMHTTSSIGARLDSIADLGYYAVMAIKICPVLFEVLTIPVWSIVAFDFALRIVTYIFVAVKYKKFCSLHTYMNKLSGFAVFTIPYYIMTGVAIPCAYVGAIIAAIASIEEFYLHASGKEYKIPEMLKSFFTAKKKENA